jgi:predicted ATPase/DNA-binding CsgD family transcriptional regulator
MLRDDRAVNTISNFLRQMTSFIGREDEIREIVHRLNNPLCQLLTLVGPGGVGKTRLALEVAHQIRDAYRDGVYFVALQPLQSAAHIPSAVVHVLGLSVNQNDDPLQKLLDYVRDRQLLLIFDNFEHLIDGAELISHMIENAPDVHVLITSREPLKLHEEWQWTVKGLSFPTDISTETVEAYSAMQLFAERTRQIRPDFMLDLHQAAVARICQLVEGIPLAIELAANWTKTLTCDAIVEAIQSGIDILTSREQNIPERHRSMRAVYNHSWRLLFEEERRIFERLSFFRGGFTREAAERVNGASLETLASLVDKSFIRQNANGRYDIHELLRQYGAEQLERSGGVEDVANRHLAFFSDYVQRCEPELKGERQLAALNKIEADFENIRAVWSYAVTRHEYTLIDRMIESLFWFGETRSFSGDVRALFQMAAQVFEPITDEPVHAAWARLAIRIYQAAEVALIDQAFAIAEKCGNQAEAAYCLMLRGVYDNEHRNPHVLEELHDALERYRRIGDDFGMAVTHLNINYYHGFFDDQTIIKTHLNQALLQARKTGNPYHMLKFLFRRGWTYASDGQYEQGEQDFKEALSLANQMGFRELAATCIGALGVMAFMHGDFRRSKVMVAQNLEAVMHLTDVGEQGVAKIYQANIACVEGHYEEALQLAEEGRILVQPNLMRERSAARVMATAEFGLGNFDRARQHACWAIAEERSQGIQLWVFPVFALLVAHDGDLKQAAELLGLIFTHPASPLGWFENWPLLTDLRAQLAQQLGAEVYAAAWERGSRLELADVVANLLRATGAQFRQPLIEPLTDRELEVLHLVADGLSNHEIAEALTVVEGTVKTHIYNLCQKLGVTHRTAAVARARALHILA